MRSKYGFAGVFVIGNIRKVSYALRIHSYLAKYFESSFHMNPLRKTVSSKHINYIAPARVLQPNNSLLMVTHSNMLMPLTSANLAVVINLGCALITKPLPISFTSISLNKLGDSFSVLPSKLCLTCSLIKPTQHNLTCQTREANRKVSLSI